MLQKWVQKYAITKKRVIFRTGIIGVDFQSYPSNKIRSKKVNVNLLGLIFSCGKILLDTGETVSTKNGRISAFHTFSYIKEPYDALKLVSVCLFEREESLYAGAAYHDRKGKSYFK